MSLSKNEGNIVQIALKTYIKLLYTRPLLTKSLTSAFTGGLGNLISQLRSPSGKVNWRGVAAYAITGFVFVGPVMHHFYLGLEKIVPTSQRYSPLIKLLIDRLLLAPPFLFAYFFILSLLEGNSKEAALKKVKEIFLPLLIMNWKVWTVLQYINLSYVPPQFRVVFGSSAALGWTVYMSTLRRK